MRPSVIFIAFFFIASCGYAQSAGPNAPGNVIDGGGGPFEQPWLNPNNARMQNDIYASLTTNNSFWQTNYLQAQNFGFNIPAGSSILGIVAEVDRYATITTSIFPADVNDSQVRIIDAAGEIRNSDDESTGAAWPNIDTDTYESYGGSTNTWGIADWTPAKINSSNFGVAIKARTSLNPLAVFNLFVDEIRITVYYLEGGAERYAVASGNWSSTGSWALTPGGTPGAPVPVDANDVFIGGGFTITNDVVGVKVNSLTIGTSETIPSGNLTFDSNLRDMTIYTGGLLITSNGDILSTFSPTLTVTGDLTLNATLTNRDFTMLMDGGSASTAIIDGTGTLGKLYVNSFTTHVGSITVTNNLSGVTLALINGHTGHLTYSGTTTNMDTNVLDLAPIDNTMEFSQTTSDAADFNIQKPSVLFYNLIISGNAPKYYNLNITVLGSLTITPTGILSNQGQRSISLSGDWTNNHGTAGFEPNACAACKVIFQGDNPQTITNVAGEQFYRVEVAKGTGATLTASGNIVIDNQLLMTSGDFDMGNNSLTGAANTVFNGGELLIGTLSTTVPELTGTYTINGGTFTFNGAGNQIIRSSASTPAISLYKVLRFAGTGNKSLSGDISVDNNITITESAVLDATVSNFGITLAGDWTNTSSFLSQGGTVTFNGQTSQFITNPAGATYYNLIINNSALSSAVVLNSPILVNGLLTFTSGHVVSTISTLLTLGVGATVAAVKDQSHVVGPVAKVISSTSTFAFPIGDGLNHMPASITPTSTISTTFIAEYFSLEQSVGTTESGVDHVSAQDYWTVQKVSGTADAAVTLVWEYPSASESEINVLNDLVVAQWNGTDWTSQGNTGTTGNFVTGSVTSNAISSFTQPYFVIGSSSIFNPLSNYRYFTATSGNWNGTNVWSYRPLGPATAPEPTSTKHVVILPGNTVTLQDSPIGESIKSMQSLRVFGTILFSDMAAQDITAEVGDGGLTLEPAANITGTDAGDEIRMSGNVTLNNASPINHTLLETNFTTQGNTIAGTGGSLPILRVTQNNQTFTGTTSYNTLAIINSATNNGTITINNSLLGAGILTNGATGTAVWQGSTVSGPVINASAPGNTIHLISNSSGGSVNIGAFVAAGAYGNLILDGANTFIQTQDIDINGDLIIEAGSVFDNSSNNRKLNIGGNWINHNGAAGFLAGINDITFDGSSPQSIYTSSGSEVFNTLIINNTSSTGVTLTQGEVHVTNDLILTDGIIFTDATNMLVLEDNATSDVGSAATFVDGPMKKIGNEAFVFPVGDGTTWARLGMETIAGFDVTTEFTCQYLHIPYSDRTSLDAGVAGVSNVEHWLLNRAVDPGTDASCRVRLFWENETTSGITDKADLRVGHYYNAGSGLKWYNFGFTLTDNGNGTGSVLSTSTFTSFSPITFVSEFGFALPIKLTRFSADVVNNSVALSWKTASELHNDYFTIQRSVNGIEFESLFNVDGAGTTTVAKSYNAVDPSPYRGASYYRLKQTDYDGKSTYSKIVSVTLSENDWTISPNPSNGSTVQLRVPKEYAHKAFVIQVIDSRGLIVRKKIVEADTQGRIEFSSENRLSDGIYFIHMTDGYIRNTMRLLISQ